MPTPLPLRLIGSYALMVILAIAMLLGVAGCQTADRPADQRANDQTNVTINAQGNNYFPILREQQEAPATQPAMRTDRLKAAQQTADGSIQGDSQQRADTSGQTDQRAEGDATVDITPGP